MQIRYLNGLTASREVENEKEAREILSKQYPDVFFGEWEDTEETVRLPVWEDEESSIDDSGEGAVAYIEEVA